MADSSIVPRLTLVFSLLALAVSSAAAATGWRAQRRIAAVPPAAAPEADVDVEEVASRVAGLERQVELLRAGMSARAAAAARGAPPAAAVGVAAPPAAEVADLSQRLARLEQLAASIQGSRGGRALSPEAMAAASRTVLDRQAGVQERAAALTLLRPSDGRADGRSHEVVVAALDLIQSPETSPKLRAGMIRDLDELKDPALKDPLVAILSRDPDGRTRREAVETLAVFYDDPQVRGLVERLKDSDPEAEVRQQAIKQLGRWQSRRQ
jgi:hypothetical protein